MENGIIRVAIGCQGRSGYNIHARHLEKDYDRYKIVAVADEIPQRRKDARNQFGAHAYKDWTKMIEAGGFDLFVNALPSPLHTPRHYCRAQRRGARAVRKADGQEPQRVRPHGQRGQKEQARSSAVSEQSTAAFF